MSYKSLYRKYRPQSFKDVVGQEHVINILKNAIKKNRVGHSYLFTGPRGTGKTSIAKIFAKSINCQNTETGDACNECMNCVMFNENSTMDVVEIDAASNNGVDEIRTLKENVNYAPTMMDKKIYIIDEVHMLTTNAFNALLKTLEEPPEHIVIVFATTEPHKIPLTVLSRCQRFDFHKLSITELVSVVKNALDSEDVKYTDDAVKKIAYLADGGARDSLSISDQAIAYSAGEITASSIEKMFGLVDNNTKIKLINAIAKKDAQQVLQLIQECINYGADLVRYTEELLVCLRDSLVYRQINTAKHSKVLKESELKGIQLASEDHIKVINNFIDATVKYRISQDLEFYFELACLDSVEKISTTTTRPVQHTVQVQSLSEEKVIEKPKTIIEKKTEVINEAPVKVIETPKPAVKPAPIKKVTKEVNPLVTVDEIINVLVQADKKITIDFKERWELITQYKHDPKRSKVAVMLEDGQVVAGCKNGIVISFNFPTESSIINKRRREPQFVSFIKEVLGNDTIVYATNKDQREEVKKKFVEYKMSGNLPAPKNISIPDDQEKEESPLEFAKSIFGDGLEIEK